MTFPLSDLQLPSISFFGRSLAEYTRFFQLDPAALRGCRVLDVAAGPASFTAEACPLGIEAVAVDPLYGSSPDALAAHVQLDYARMFGQMRAKPHLFKLGAEAQGVRRPHFASLDAAEQDRRAAAGRFLGDYAAHFVHGRYVSGRLPHLPFKERTFDLVLCAHLLFIYAQQLDFAFHLAACRELARVSAGEVRIHSLCGTGGRIYPDLDRLRDELRQDGIESEVVAVDYEFFAGSDSMLVLRKDGRKAH